jgi:hypothetical protein
MALRLQSPFTPRMTRGGALLCVGLAGAAGLRAPDDILARSREMYGALRSYADSGSVEVEYGATSADRHTFTTLFNRAPRRFLFEFRKQGGDRYVIWGDPDAFHNWWKTTGVRSDYPNPSNTGVFTGAGAVTAESAGAIPPLLYAKGALPSILDHFDDASSTGFEEIDGRRCARISGTAKDVYGATGKAVNVRKVTVWIDAQSLLIRRILEERQALPGTRNRTTITFRPVANPTIDEARFRFSPPAAP